MIHDYPDTSFLCALFRNQDNSGLALAYRSAMKGSVFATSLLEFEFIQSIRLQVFLNGNDRTKGYPQGEANRMIERWEKNLAEGDVKLVSCDTEAVHQFAKSLSLRHTASGGHRTLDVLHVATAVHLGAKNFLTFDTRQKKLAKSVGLKTPL